MELQVSQELWRDLVRKFLGVDSTAEEEVKEAQLAQCLPQLSHCATKLRFLYDQHQIYLVVEHCVSGLVDPGGGQSAKHIALLLASLLQWQSRGVHLSSALSDRVILWLSQALQHHAAIGEANATDTVIHIFRALSTVLKDVPDHSDETFLNLGGSKGSLVQVLEGNWSWQVKTQAMQCLHLLTYVSPEVVTEARQQGEEIFPPDVVSSIQRVVIGMLRQPPPDTSLRGHHRPYLHLVASGISVLYNLVVCSPGDVLGNIIVSTCRPFIFYGLPGYNHSDLLMHNITTSEVDISLSSGVESDSAARNYTNRNRRKRLRRKRANPSRTTADCSNGGGGGLGGPAVPSLTGVGPPPPPPAEALHTISLKPEWTRMKRGKNTVAVKKDEEQQKEEKITAEADTFEDMKLTSGQDHLHHLSTTTTSEMPVSSSETDHSDLEGSGERESALMSRVRQCSLQAINAVIDKVGGQNKFSYWAPLMCPGASLMTCVLRDPAPGVRMAALQVINTFLLDSAQVLTLADDSESAGKSSYSTLGHQLGVSVRELHRCLARALLSERVPVALVRTLKTAELLVQNVNYSKLQPGLLTKLVTHVKYFMTYKEAVVRANAFSVMVSVLMVKPQVDELRRLLLRHLIPAPPALAAPPSVTPQPPLEEHLPSEEEEEELEEEVERLHLHNEEGEGEGGDDKQERKTMVSWLVRRCVDSLLAIDTDSARGIYIQVQLQSLKVLSALVSEHLSLIQPSLPLIQHVITVCSEVCRESPNTASVATSSRHAPQLEWRTGNASTATETFDPTLTSPDPGAVMEHTYTLLGALLGAVKAQQERISIPSASTSDITTKSSSVHPDLGPTPALAAHPFLAPAQQDPEDQPSLTSHQALDLWLWALQGPLQPLFKHAEQQGKSPEKGTTGGAGGWRSGDREGKTGSERVPEEQVKQLAAMATVLTHLSPAVVEGIGEAWLDRITDLLHHLLSTTAHADLRLAGIRIMAIAVGFSGVAGSRAGVRLVQETAEAACDLLLAPREVSVNRDRLLAAWALANVTSVLELYSDSGGNEGRPHNITPVLPSQLTVCMVEAGLVACRDKGKIKPHGVRCVGNVVAWALRLNCVTTHDTTPISSSTQDTPSTHDPTTTMPHTHNRVPATLPLTCDAVSLSEALVQEAVEGLVECAISGSNMKTRWNACHALGSILAAAEASLDQQPWKSEVMTALSCLVEGFKNYKVRIHACSAVTGLAHREGYGADYARLWGALLRGLDAARGIPHYQEARHRDDLVNQISQGLWQLTAVMTLEDAGNLSELLQLHYDIAAPLLNQSYHTLPPERTSHALRAQARVEELLGCDALTESQQSALIILENFTCVSSWG